MKKFLAFDGINYEYESFETIEEARKWLEEIFLVPGEGYHPDMNTCKIFELKETASYDVIDSKNNYKDEDSEFWPYSNEYEEIWKHKWVK